LQATQTQLQHAKNELVKYDIKKQRADESLATYIAEIDARKHKVEKDFNKLKNNYELDIAAYPDIIHDLDDQKEALMQSIADAIGELRVIQGNLDRDTGVLEKLEEQKELVLVQIEENDGVLMELEEDIDDKRDRLSEIKKLLKVGEEQLIRLKEDITTSEIELADLRADLQTRKNSVEDDMKITIQKSTDVVKRLIELEKREAEINTNINNRIKAVELREQVMARREAKIAGMEAKAQEYAKFMKL